MHHDTTVFVGLDVHKDSITVACVGSHPAEQPFDLGTLGTQQYAIDRLVKKLSGRGPLRFAYEAGPCGFWLRRYLQAKGQDCVVASPSLIPKRPGERVKTDRRDARNLALLLRAGTLTAVHVPTPEQEAFRDVVRAWQQSKRGITAAKQRLKSFLLRNDIRYSGRATWNAAHRRWLSELVLPVHHSRSSSKNSSTPSASANVGANVWNVYFGALKLGRFLERYLRIEDAYGRLKRHDR